MGPLLKQGPWCGGGCKVYLRQHMHEYLFILGREPELSTAEIEAKAADWKLEVLEVVTEAVLVRSEIALDPGVLKQLGGSVKLIEVFSCVSRSTFAIEAIQGEITPDKLIELFPSGRIEFGLSVYGASNKDRILAQKHVLRLKQDLKRAGRMVRAVTSKEPQLSAVTVVRQGLLKQGKELVLFRGQQYDVFGITIAVQDYQAYGLRDFGRPAADPKSGMVPPKLAQMMLNISQVQSHDVLLDPFCGSGTILQEAALLGVKEIHGRDNAAKAIKDSQENLRWLVKEFPSIETKLDILLGDARKIDIHPTVIVTEPFLGRPLHGNESNDGLQKQIGHLEELYRSAFQAWAKILRTGSRVVMIWPEFVIDNQPTGLDLDVESFGFVIAPVLSGTSARILNGSNQYVLTYGREDAKVRRQIRKWIKV